LTVIIDRNGLKGMDNAESGKSLEPLKERWQAFGWAVRAIDGHDMNQLCNALDWAVDEVRDVPAAIIARTVKGRGVSFIENAPDFHNAAMTEKQLGMALEELESHLEDKRDCG
jgi:transketolase